MRIADIMNEIINNTNDLNVPQAIVTSFYEKAPAYPFADYLPCADQLMIAMSDWKHLCNGIVYVYH